jgi:23S rRNA pseudouridine2605 synthase
LSLIRLQKLISRYGITSRRKAELLITDGRVRVNGRIVKKIGTKVPDCATIEIDRQVVNRKITPLYIMMNKPSGYLCSRARREGKSIIYDLIDNRYEENGLFSVGRLDAQSEGLLLLTNDGEFAQKVGHPSGGIIKKYLVLTDKNIPYNLIDGWKKGTYIKGERYSIRDYKKVSARKAVISLVEGKNREIRKLFTQIGLNVIKLKRIAIGPLELGSLTPGKIRELTQSELNLLLYKVTGTY